MYLTDFLLIMSFQEKNKGARLIICTFCPNIGIYEANCA